MAMTMARDRTGSVAMTIARDRSGLQRSLLVAALLAVAAITVAIVRAEPDLALTGDSGAALAAGLAAAALVVAAAVATWRAGVIFPVLLAATALAWLAAEWNNPGAGAAFTLGLLLYAAWPPLLAAAALRGLDERPFDRPAIVVVTASFGIGVGLLGVASAAVFDPDAQGCLQCPANLVLVTDAPSLGNSLAQVGLAATAVWAAAFAVLAAVRIIRSSPARRRWSAPVLLPAVAAVALFAVDAIHGLDRGFLSNDPTDRALRLAEAGALALVAAGVALTRWRTRRTRAALARLVLDIGAAPAPGELRSWLAKSLGDPSLQLLHRMESGEWVDAVGRLANPASGGGRETTRVRARGEEVLAVIHRPGLLDDPALLSELVTTARLALEHEGLHAARRARLEELRASRARLVAAADAKRRELERDLHDGAQQRLVAIALAIRLARRQIAADDPLLDARLGEAEEKVRTAVVQLRDVAHGLFPTVLADEGLRAALDELSEHTPRLVPRKLPDGRFPASVESAAYFAAVESLRLTERDVTVDGVAKDGQLRLMIDAGTTLDEGLTQIRDRVGAVGGTVALAGGELRLEMPCES
jgi:signal transduction histidine kinase